MEDKYVHSVEEHNNKTIIAKQRCEMLAALISGVHEAYSSPSTTEDQKSFIETTIGAALWYIPKINESFSGLISKKLLESFSCQNSNEVKISEEHIYPRKISASKLLEMDKEKITADEVYKYYVDFFCKLCLITPQENKRAIKYQKKGIFKTPIQVYKDAKIELVRMNGNDYKLVKKKNQITIERLLKQAPVLDI